jgi:hypothetical protein
MKIKNLLTVSDVLLFTRNSVFSLHEWSSDIYIGSMCESERERERERKRKREREDKKKEKRLRKKRRQKEWRYGFVS